MSHSYVKACLFILFTSFGLAITATYEMSSGTHILADFYDCAVPDEASELEAMLRSAAKESGSTALEFMAHKFDPCGISAVLILAESHISVHSWPEHRCAAVDVYTCGHNTDTDKAIAYLKTVFNAGYVKCRKISRGEQMEKTTSKDFSNSLVVKNDDIEIYTESLGNPSDPAILLISGSMC